MPDFAYVDIDPATKQPLTQSVQTPPPAVNRPVANTQPQWSPEAFAAQSAEAQAREAQRHGEYVTQDAFENMRAKAYEQAMQTQREMALDAQRRAGELQKQEAFQQFQQFAPRNMTAEESKDASGLTNATDQIMMLLRQNQDIPRDDPYRQAVIGDWSAAVAKMTDPRVRLYEATRGGSIISLGRGLLQDTGQVAGKEQAQDLIKQLMPGPGDSPEMSARKSIDMLQMTMNGIRSKIDGLPANVDTSPLKNAYARAYSNYAQLLGASGSDAQRNFQALAPQQLWQNAPQVPAVQPVVKAGMSGPSQAVVDNLNKQVQGQQPQQQSQVIPGLPGQTPETRTGFPSGLPSQFPSVPGSIGAAAQQSGQFRGGPRVQGPGMAQPDPALIAQMLQQQQPQSTIFQTVPPAVTRGAEAESRGEQAAGSWLQGLLPENWTPGAFQQ